MSCINEIIGLDCVARWSAVLKLESAALLLARRLSTYVLKIKRAHKNACILMGSFVFKDALLVALQYPYIFQGSGL